jgi:hypothetical protein
MQAFGGQHRLTPNCHATTRSFSCALRACLLTCQGIVATHVTSDDSVMGCGQQQQQQTMGGTHRYDDYDAQRGRSCPATFGMSTAPITAPATSGMGAAPITALQLTA